MPLFVCPKETGYASYPSLLCTRVHFLSIPPHCLLSLSILPINYSAQSLPPTEAMSAPPLEMREWQVRSVSSIHPDNRKEETWLVVFMYRKLQKTESEKEWSVRQRGRGNCISNITTCFSSCKHSLTILITFARLSHIASPCLCISSTIKLVFLLGALEGSSKSPVLHPCVCQFPRLSCEYLLLLLRFVLGLTSSQLL